MYGANSALSCGTSAGLFAEPRGGHALGDARDVLELYGAAKVPHPVSLLYQKGRGHRPGAPHAGAGIFGRDCGERSRFPDGAVRNHNSAGLDHTRCSEARIGDYICARMMVVSVIALHTLAISLPAVASPDELLRRGLTYTRCGKNR